MSRKLQLLDDKTHVPTYTESALERAAAVAVATEFLSSKEKNIFLNGIEELSAEEFRLSEQFAFSVPTTDKEEAALWATVYNGLIFSLPGTKVQTLVSTWLYN
tara:strand:- start:3924 stop:4232 length:309 start_codon:yes stop_codon:yes gene_type:complete